FYALKSPENPQGTRILVNEYLGAKVFAAMGIATSTITPIFVSQQFLDANPEAHFASKGDRLPLRPGLHLGSRYEVNPETTAVYDLLPESLIPRIKNPGDFLGAFVSDQWLANQDARQFVFFREQEMD